MNTKTLRQRNNNNEAFDRLTTKQQAALLAELMRKFAPMLVGAILETEPVGEDFVGDLG